MKNSSPFLAGLHLKTLGKKHLTSAQKLANKIALLKQKNIFQLSECFRGFIPSSRLQPSGEKEHSRRRLYCKQNTFWAFFSQIIDADGGCKEVVRKMQAYATVKGMRLAIFIKFMSL